MSPSLKTNSSASRLSMPGGRLDVDQLAPDELQGVELAGRFRLLHRLGQGTTGVVYAAEDLLLPGERVAVKVLLPHVSSDFATLKRFRREIRLGRMLRHPLIVEIFEFKADSAEECYVVMELVSGEDLATRLLRVGSEPLPLAEILLILADLTEALSHAHSKGVIHRDCKPQNILLTDEGRAKVSDFGIARLLEDEQGLTRTGESLGTPYYMSPEQFRGEQPSTQSDIYAVGIIAFELLVGERPFVGDSYYAIGLAHLTKPLPHLPSRAVDAPAWLLEFVAQATQKNRKNRPSDLLAISRELRLAHARIRGAADDLVPSHAPKHRVRAHRRRRAQTAAAVILPLLLVALALRHLHWLEHRIFVQVAAVVLRAESVLGLPLQPVRGLMGLQVSLNEPEQVFPLIRASMLDSRARDEAHALLKAGIDLELRDAAGTPIVVEACRYGERNLPIVLDRLGINPLAQDLQGKTCAHLWMELGTYSNARVFYQFGPDGPIQDEDGNTFLHSWVQSGSLEFLPPVRVLPTPIDLLFETRNKDGLTALELAFIVGNLEKISKLFELGANASTQLFTGGTSSVALTPEVVSRVAIFTPAIVFLGFSRTR